MDERKKTFYINTLTIFPEAFINFQDISIIGNARRKKIWDLQITDINKFSDKNNNIDAKPYGGGPGMILKADINLGEVPENIMSEFKTTVESIFLNKINIKIEKGDVINSPIQLNESKIEEEENLAKDQISKDKEIQDFVEKFNGKIKPETIKPSK